MADSREGALSQWRRAAVVELKEKSRQSGARPEDVAAGRWLGDFLDQQSETGLLPAEEKLLAAAATGEECVLAERLGFKAVGAAVTALRAHSSTPARPDEQATAEALRLIDQQLIRAGFLRFLAMGGDKQFKTQERGISVRGAVIIGSLNMHRAKEVGGLVLQDCYFSDAVVVTDGRLECLHLDGSYMPGLFGEGVDIREDLFLRGVQCNGPALFRVANLGGYVDCEGAAFALAEGEHAGHDAFNCDGATIRSDVIFKGGFTADGRVSLAGAKVGGGLICDGGGFSDRRGDTSTKVLNCDNASFENDVSLCKATANGRISFDNTTINGILRCTGATFTNLSEDGEAIALDCRRATIASDVELNDDRAAPGVIKFTAQGVITFAGAKIGGSLNCRGAQLQNQTANGEGNALDGTGVEVGGSVDLREGFTSHGVVSFRNAKIKGNMSLIFGEFYNLAQRQGSQIEMAETALNFSGATIRGVLWLGPTATKDDATPKIYGSIDLQGGHAHQVIDHPDAWPGGAAAVVETKDGAKLKCALLIDGFTYDRFVGGGRYDASSRMEWLARQPEAHREEDFRPQPYQQLVKVLTDMGHDRDARLIAKERQFAQRRADFLRTWGPSARAKQRWRWLAWPFGALIYYIFERLGFGLLAGYGYGQRRIIGMLAAIWLAGAFVYGQAAEQGLIVPTAPYVYAEADRAKACAKSWTSCAAMPVEHTAFEPFLYSADVMAPVVAFGIETDWEPLYTNRSDAVRPNGSAMTLTIWPLSLNLPAWGLRTFFWVQIIAGWVLSALLLAVMSGLMKKSD
ncbi:MAG: hypothetical protein MRY74_07825 [Neomegalonema sp.]|nr:hypothetical protein [Neomegalonema sp.]